MSNVTFLSLHLTMRAAFARTRINGDWTHIASHQQSAEPLDYQVLYVISRICNTAWVEGCFSVKYTGCAVIYASPRIHMQTNKLELWQWWNLWWQPFIYPTQRRFSMGLYIANRKLAKFKIRLLSDSHRSVNDSLYSWNSKIYVS